MPLACRTLTWLWPSHDRVFTLAVTWTDQFLGLLSYSCAFASVSGSFWGHLILCLSEVTSTYPPRACNCPCGQEWLLIVTGLLSILYQQTWPVMENLLSIIPYQGPFSLKQLWSLVKLILALLWWYTFVSLTMHGAMPWDLKTFNHRPPAWSRILIRWSGRFIYNFCGVHTQWYLNSRFFPQNLMS